MPRRGGERSCATVRGDCGFAKTLWHDAERRGFVPGGMGLDPSARGGPFAHLDAGTTARDDGRFLTPGEAAAVLDELPGVAWRTLFGLAYWAGLRCPSETHALTWADVDWHRGRLDVRSPKTERHRGHERRAVPIAPELMPLLREAYDAAEEGAERVVDLSHKHKRGVYDTIDRAAERAGVAVWRPLWLTVRSSCEMRWLAAGHPSSHVAKWMGHGVQVAERHYRLLVPDESFAAASTSMPTDVSDTALPGVLRLADPKQKAKQLLSRMEPHRSERPAIEAREGGFVAMRADLQSGGGENRTPVSR
ncbi:MAG: tyrosine-type recombinase/integrase [Planctomycetota bacterium]